MYQDIPRRSPDRTTDADLKPGSKSGDHAVLHRALIGVARDADAGTFRASDFSHREPIQIERNSHSADDDAIDLGGIQVGREIVAASLIDDEVRFRVTGRNRRRIRRAFDEGRARFDLLERLHGRRGRAGRSERAATLGEESGSAGAEDGNGKYGG